MDSPILVTGGAGFIGSNFICNWLSDENGPVVNLDKLTYAVSRQTVSQLAVNRGYSFVQGDICDRKLIRDLLGSVRPSAIVHFAAETHVDRSILGPEAFITTNVLGTFSLLEEARRYWSKAPSDIRSDFRFVHVSTDEVFGSLHPDEEPFTEQRAYAPNSPYSASKAASDHFARAYYHTYGFPTVITNCSNNYGPFQFPEKLIPLIISRGKTGRSLPIYGDGMNKRDWLFVDDHCRALTAVLRSGRIGESYNIGGGAEMTNLEVVRKICSILDDLAPIDTRRDTLITFVTDRIGHDRRYAIDASKVRRDTGWAPRETFDSGIEKTVKWYLQNESWIGSVTGAAYSEWLERQYSKLKV